MYVYVYVYAGLIHSHVYSVYFDDIGGSVVLYCFLRNIVTTEIEYAGTLTSLHFVTIPIENGSSSKSYNGYAPMSSENELV